MIECFKYTPINKGACLGSANIYISKWDMEIYGITLYGKDSKQWLNFPSRVYEKDGEKKYIPYFRFRTSDVYNRFCTAVKTAIQDYQQSTINKEIEETTKNDEIPF